MAKVGRLEVRGEEKPHSNEQDIAWGRPGYDELEELKPTIGLSHDS